MSVSARSYMSASLAVLTAGVVALAPVTPDVATPQSLTADVTLAAVSGFTNFTKPILVPPYTLTQAAYLASDAVAVAASGVAVAATYTGAALTELGAKFNNFFEAGINPITAPSVTASFYQGKFVYQFNLIVQKAAAAAESAPSVQASVARLNTDLTRLKTDSNAVYLGPTWPVDVTLAAGEQPSPTASSIGDAGNLGGATGILLGIVEKLQTDLIAIGPYAVTQAAYLASDLVAVAASGVAVAATYTTAALLDGALYRVNFNDGETDGQELPPAFQLPPPSVTASVARFNTDLTRLKTDWANTFNPAHFNDYVAGLAAPESTVPTLLPPPPPPVLASHARAASVTPRQAPSAEAAAASAQAAPTAEQSQRPLQHRAAPLRAAGAALAGPR